MSFLFLKKTTICFILMSIVFTTFSYSQKKSFKKEPFNEEDSFESYEKYIWYRNKKNKLKVNKKNFKTIYKNTKSSKDDYFIWLESYSVVLPNKKLVGKNLSFAERTYVHAYVTEYLYKCQEKFKKEDPYKDRSMVHWVLRFKYRNAYNEEFKKHNYYGLKRLKEKHLKHFVPFEDPRSNKPTDLTY